MIVIGFTGPAGAGKDTAANLLAEHLVQDRGLKVRIQAWANLLKIAAARSLGFDGSGAELIAYMDDFKVNGSVVTSLTLEAGRSRPTERRLSGREFLERFGTEGGRDVYGQNHWVDLALPSPGAGATMWRARAQFPNVVLDTTTRFPNEAARIREWGGQVWRIERPEDHLRAALDGHVSRAGIPAEHCEAVIQNDGTIEDLAYNLYGTFVRAEAAGDIVVPV